MQRSQLMFGGISMDDRLGQIITDIIEAADATLEEEQNQVVIGSLMTYAEVLTIIQEQLSDDERKQFNLDFDIEKKYL